VELVWAGEFETKEEARANEKKVKRLKTEKKMNLIDEELTKTVQIKQDLGIKDK